MAEFIPIYTGQHIISMLRYTPSVNEGFKTVAEKVVTALSVASEKLWSIRLIAGKYRKMK